MESETNMNKALAYASKAENSQESGRVPFWQKVAYGAANPVETLTIWVNMGMMMAVFHIGLGMDPIAIGWILAIWRVYDAISDPVMGNISDNARTRWGRRRPFIAVGAVLTSIFLPLIWWVPRDVAPWVLNVLLLVGGMLLYSSFTIWAMPYYSLQLEMTKDYNERTNISAYRAFFQKIMGLFTGWFMAMATSQYFADEHGKPDIVEGMRYVGLLMGVLVLVLGVLPALFVKERFYVNEAAKQRKQPLFRSLGQTLKTWPFLILLVIVMTQIFGMAMPGSLGKYLNYYYVCQGDIALGAKYEGAINTAMFLPALLAIPFCTWYSARFGKQQMLYLLTCLSIAGYLSVYLFFIPGRPILMVIPAILKGTITVGLWMVAPSMQADIADYDELTSHARREGSFCSVFSWSTKVAWSLVAVMSGYLIAFSGFKIEFGSAQPPEVLRMMLHLYVWTPVGFLLVSLLAIRFYGLSRDRMREIRRELDARHGTTAPGPSGPA